MKLKRFLNFSPTIIIRETATADVDVKPVDATVDANADARVVDVNATAKIKNKLPLRPAALYKYYDLIDTTYNPVRRGC